MTIKSSGPLSMAEIAAEFGGGNPLYLSQFYRGGGRVPDIGQNGAISTGGSINIGMFYGTVLYVPGSAALGNGTTRWTVPPSVHNLNVSHLLGAGGGGAGSSDGGYTHNGPGGYGGNAGGHWSGNIAVNPGDIIDFVIGYGGAGGTTSCWIGYGGANGGGSAIYRNGALVVSVGGGAGAPANIHDNDGINCGAVIGGVVESIYPTIVPSGEEQIETCPSGYTLTQHLDPVMHIYSMCDRMVGGTPSGPTAGANSALGAGGSPGGINASGGNGGWGAGGGGAGCSIASCLNYLTGGSGGSGYVSWSW